MKKVLLSMLLTMSLSLFVQAQDSNKDLLNKLVEKGVLTQDEASELSVASEVKKEESSLAQSVKKVRTAFNTPFLQVGGYGLLMYNYDQKREVKNNLSTRGIFLWMSGNLNEHFRYYILSDLADPTLYEFYGEWMPAKGFNLRGGQFKVPFTLENMISLTNLETILNTRSVSHFAGMSGDPLQYSNQKETNKTGRDLGVQASGSFFSMNDHDLVQYSAGIFQGAGMNVRENNRKQDFAGTLILQPTKELRIAGGLYAGRATYWQQEYYQSHVRDRWALSADYTNDKFYFRSEWIQANDGGIKKEGLYGLTKVKLISDKLTAVAKVDYLNNYKKADLEVMDYAIGFDYYFWTMCRLHVNYTYSDYSKYWKDMNSENAVQVQMQIVF